MDNFLFAVKDPEFLFATLRRIIREELAKNQPTSIPTSEDSTMPFIKMAEVMELLQVTKPTIYDWVNKGYFKMYRLGSRTYFHRDEIIEFIKKSNQ